MTFILEDRCPAFRGIFKWRPGWPGKQPVLIFSSEGLFTIMFKLQNVNNSSNAKGNCVVLIVSSVKRQSKFSAILCNAHSWTSWDVKQDRLNNNYTASLVL